jgi:hypothetical protein
VKREAKGQEQDAGRMKIKGARVKMQGQREKARQMQKGEERG